eukprot:EG_transcript_27067
MLAKAQARAAHFQTEEAQAGPSQMRHETSRPIEENDLRRWLRVGAACIHVLERQPTFLGTFAQRPLATDARGWEEWTLRKRAIGWLEATNHAGGRAKGAGQAPQMHIPLWGVWEARGTPNRSGPPLECWGGGAGNTRRAEGGCRQGCCRAVEAVGEKRCVVPEARIGKQFCNILQPLPNLGTV